MYKYYKENNQIIKNEFLNNDNIQNNKYII